MGQEIYCLRGICLELLTHAEGDKPQGDDLVDIVDTLSLIEHLLNFTSTSKIKSIEYVDACLSCHL